MIDAESRFASAHLSLILLALGVVLIAASFLPFGSSSKRVWTLADSQAYGQVTRELHQSTYQTAAEGGRTDQEMERYRANLEQEFTKLQNKLAQAQQEPHRWSRLLWWTGAGLAGLGGLLHMARQHE